MRRQAGCWRASLGGVESAHRDGAEIERRIWRTTSSSEGLGEAGSQCGDCIALAESGQEHRPAPSARTSCEGKCVCQQAVHWQGSQDTDLLLQSWVRPTKEEAPS